MESLEDRDRDMISFFQKDKRLANPREARESLHLVFGERAGRERYWNRIEEGRSREILRH